jgi:DNA-binding HxlR family transcriptional regulator
MERTNLLAMAERKKNSTFSRNEACILHCDLTYSVNLLGGRWKLLILNKLEESKRRFSDLKKEFSYMSERMLVLQLKAMEKDGLVTRTVYPAVPPRVEYELTDVARQLGPILQQLSEWGSKHKEVTALVEVAAGLAEDAADLT